MLRYIYQQDLQHYPQLAGSLYRDRQTQGRALMAEGIQIGEDGRDHYDTFDPLYVIWEQNDGSHGGSLRFLPTTGPVMINDHFQDLIGGGTLVSPLIWEASGMCVSPRAGVEIAAALMLAGCEVMRNFGVAHIAAVYDVPLREIYRSLDAQPEVIGERGEICLGLWEFSDELYMRLLKTAGVEAHQSQGWFDRSFGAVERPAALPMSA